MQMIPNSINWPLITDSYKLSHWKQYPPGTEFITSYIEARGYSTDIFPEEPEVVLFGLDFFIEKYLKGGYVQTGTLSKGLRRAGPVTLTGIDRAERIAKAHGLPFNRAGWERIVSIHNGFLPVTIQALNEGTVTKLHTPIVQVTNLDPALPWLTSYVETALLRAVWYPTTVATLSREAKKVIKRFLQRTGDPSLLPFKLHDFGARGVSSQESAILGGSAHLVNFMGTDTVEAVDFLESFYGEVFGFSIPASEHSTITTWGREREADAYRNMLTTYGNGALVACVSDSYDIFNACREIWGEQLHDEVEGMNATLVVRPDSGDPVSVTLQVVEILGSKFGYTTNEKGFKVLNPKVRIIQGDGINLRSIEKILANFESAGWSADNIAFGMGGGLLQQVNRDTLKFAMKANEAVIDGERVEVSKSPVSDLSKASKAGAQAVVKKDGVLYGIRAKDLVSGQKDYLRVRAQASYFTEYAPFSEIRKRAELG